MTKQSLHFNFIKIYKLKIHLTILFTLMSIMTILGQTTYKEWEKEAKNNVRLLPKYGDIQKTNEQILTDKQFVEETLKIEKYKGNKRAASDDMIKLGFQYLYKGDLKTAMYRFNQAFLLDSENTDIYWGFGAVYVSLSQSEKAKEQYEQGLKLKPDNSHLLTDYATYFLVKYYEAKKLNHHNANEYLDKAIDKLTMSYTIDKKDSNTLYKLSVCHLMNSDCEDAIKFYNLCKEEGGKPIDERYTQELNRICN